MTASCGSAASGAGSTTPGARRTDRALELTLRTPEGEWIHVGDLRGQPVLLFLFATWDGISQAAFRPVQRFARGHEDIAIIGIASQPDAAMLLDPYARVMHAPFPLTYDPEERIHEGTSVLGDIRAVPTFIMFDARGREVARHEGFPNTHTLPRLREQAIDRGGIGERDDAPIIGISQPR